MSHRTSPLRIAAAAIKKNILPGLLLQAVMGVFLAAYFWHQPTRFCLEQISAIKEEAGFAFTALAYCLSSAILPEILKIAFFQKGKPTKQNLWSAVSSAPIWAAAGIMVDLFYRFQIFLFGSGNDLPTLLAKIAVDQFLFSPFVANFLVISAFCWREENFRSASFFSRGLRAFFVEKVFPVQIAGWCVWPPAVAIIYSMPPATQIPIAVLVQTFWVLVFTALNRSKSETVEI